jgi:hypothetical protein
MRLLLILLLTLNLLQAKKIALLIGNNDYSFQPLNNPLNDVDGIYKTLKEIGFDISKKDVLKNASQSQMQKSLANFSQRAKDAEIALIYFSGHGMQVNNINYMFPARTTATKPVDLFGLVDLNYFIQSATSAKYGIVLVDACRNNPLVKFFQNGKHKGSSAKKGLGQVTPTTRQMVIGFATGAGDTADDGGGSMSPYARALSARLKENDDIRNILGKVAKDVARKYEQNPIYRGNLASSVFLRGNNTSEENNGCVNGQKYIIKPAQFKTITERVLFKPTYRIYKWTENGIKKQLEPTMKKKPPVKVIFSDAYTKLSIDKNNNIKRENIPATYKAVSNWFEIDKDVDLSKISPSINYKSIVIPATYKTISRRALIRPASEKTVPCN